MRVKTGIPAIVLHSVSSTNAYAADLIAKGQASDGLVIRAIEQTAGKGQDDRGWESEPGKNLTISIVFKPAGLMPVKQFMLNKIASLAVYEFLTAKLNDAEIFIKWPNDVYIGNKKAAGILINNTIAGNEICWSVTGIGININQTRFLSNAPNPVSLKQFTGITYNLDNCLVELCACYDFWIRNLLNRNYNLIDHKYLQVLYRLNVQTGFIYQGQCINAMIAGVGEFGHLILKLPDGSELICDLKEIQMII